jgi:type IV secretion system protein VirB9
MTARPSKLLCLVAAALIGSAAQADDPRLRELTYDAQAVVTVPVRRGVVTHVVLAEDEAITDVGSGMGGDCARPESAWCIAAQAGSRHLFVKPKLAATGPNNVAVVTDRRTHAFRFEVLADADRRSPVYRLVLKAPPPPALVGVTPLALPELPPLPPVPAPPSPAALVAERLAAAPTVANTAYSIAEGPGSTDIVPSLVFDDGRFTYLRFAGHREVPAVFHVLGDGSEAIANARMDGDLLVVDRVSRRLMLRSGAAVVGVWNDAYDAEGDPPEDGTTVPGVRRVVRGQTTRIEDPSHE